MKPGTKFFGIATVVVAGITFFFMAPVLFRSRVSLLLVSAARRRPASALSAGGPSGAVKVKTPEALQREQEERKSPLQITFDIPTPPQMNVAVPLAVVIQSNPAKWPAAARKEGRLVVRLSLPPGIQMADEGWRSVEQPPEAKDDPSGPWSVYEREQIVDTQALPQVLARFPISLKVTEEGLNWTIAVRAQFEQGTENLQGVGALFVTLQQDVAEFHINPKRFLKPAKEETPPPSTHPESEKKSAETN